LPRIRIAQIIELLCGFKAASVLLRSFWGARHKPLARDHGFPLVLLLSHRLIVSKSLAIRMEAMLFHGIERSTVNVNPCVAHILSWLDTSVHQDLVSQLRDDARRMAGTPMAMHNPVLNSGGQMSVFMLHLGHCWDHQTYRYVDRIADTHVR